MNMYYVILICLFFINLTFCNEVESQIEKAFLPNGSIILGKEETSKVGKVAIAYKGIPYARKPINERRWKRPVKKKRPFIKPLEAFNFKSICPQYNSDGSLPTESMDEDCLYMNIWRPQKSHNLPVIVWIHGGGFTTGSAQVPSYNGLNMASKGVVFVSFNYRLGPLGFFAHKGATEKKYSGNFGLHDQVMALQWIQDNIQSFGGNPNNITLMGESAGAVSVKFLLNIEKAQGLFHKAVIQSAPNFVRIPKYEKRKKSHRLPAYKLSFELAKTLNCNQKDKQAELACMKNKSFHEIISAARTLYLADKKYTSGPYVDNDLFKKQPFIIEQEQGLSSIPIIIGSNKHEATYYGNPPFLLPSQYKEYIYNLYKDDLQLTKILIEQYPAKTRQEMKDSYIDFITDYQFGFDATKLAKNAVRKGNTSIYQYFFSRVSPGASKAGMGASHGFEIPYFFDNLNDIGAKQGSYNYYDLIIAQEMSQRLLNFAKFSNPNTSQNMIWQRVNEENNNILEFNETTKKLKINMSNKRLKAIEMSKKYDNFL